MVTFIIELSSVNKKNVFIKLLDIVIFNIKVSFFYALLNCLPDSGAIHQ